jgi:PAS domain S-box-containing protein
MVTTSLEGRVLGWSRGATVLFGWREREILGRPIAELVHEKHLHNDSQSLGEVATGHCVRDAMVKYVRRDGALLTCVQTMVPVRDATGRVTAATRIVFDLTSLREAERALRRMVAQVADVLAENDEPELVGASDYARTLRAERDRTRRHFLRVVAAEARTLGSELCVGLVAATAPAFAVRALEVEQV